MRVRSRWVLSFCGLAMSAPAASTATAQVVATPFTPPPNVAVPSAGTGTVIPLEHGEDSMPGMPPGPSGMTPDWRGSPASHSYTPGMRPGEPPSPAPAPTMGASMVPATSGEKTAGHHHHGLFGHRHCVECQRARVKSADGVDVPPPPGYPGGPSMAVGETIVSGPMIVSERVIGPGAPNAPGYAVVGGPNEAAGFAMTDGPMPSSEPAPIGVARGSTGGTSIRSRMATRMGLPGSGAGSYDPSVMTTSVLPPPAPMSGPGHDRPHIISHLLRPSMYIFHHQEREDRRREQHAAEAYGPDTQKVNDVPASMVYGQR